MRFLRRLRWQLTLSHLLATAFTLLSMIAAVVLIAGSWLAAQGNESRQPASDARNVAGVISGMVQANADPADLNAVLRSIADGNLRVTVGFAQPTRGGQPFQFGLSNVAYIVVLDPNGAVIASSDPSGASFSPPERQEWNAVASAAQSNGSTSLRSGGGPAALGAAPIVSDSGARLATVVLATTVVPPPSGGFDIARGLTIFGFASIAVLAAASVFALVSSSGVAIILSRQLVKRLERLGAAAERLARGDLSQRVDAGPDDEVGQLARRFNRMAADLEHTLSELRAERDRVTGLLDDRRQLVASASHELRTPVATVRGYLESALGQAEVLPDGLRSDLEVMERELARLQQLIEDLFALSQAAVGRLALRLEPVDAGLVVQRLVETAAPLAWRQRRVQLIAEVADDVPLARADQQRLEQIVSNLLGNAIRHTPPGGLVAAAISFESPGQVRLDVRDTGEGIRPEDIPHVFERFFRGRSQHGEGGAGLGLALVKELTEAMNGSVEAASTPGEGSCFTVRLPAA
jgi:signal transduction histidine kinase